jgi:hypothetical protein
LGMQMRERTGLRGGVWLLNGQGAPEVFAVVAWCSERGLARAGGVVARMGPGVSGAHVLEGRGWP